MHLVQTCVLVLSFSCSFKNSALLFIVTCSRLSAHLRICFCILLFQNVENPEMMTMNRRSTFHQVFHNLQSIFCKSHQRSNIPCPKKYQCQKQCRNCGNLNRLLLSLPLNPFLFVRLRKGHFVL